MSPLLALLLALPAALPPGSPSPALGIWLANGARLELRSEEGKIVGRLAAEGGPCAVPPGTELLRGALLDDSLSANVRLCLVAPQCGADPASALAVLLVTRILTGGVHSKAPCARDVHALILRRPGPPVAMAAPAPSERLSKTPAPPPAVRRTQQAPPTDPRVALNEIALTARLPTPAAGEIPGRPVGEPPHPAVYDPRDARKTAAEQGEADRLLAAGALLLQQGRFEKAREQFRKAVASDPLRAEAYNGVGVTFYARGDLDEALEWYKRSLEADPRFGDAFYNMACVYALEQHKDLAFRYLRMAALNRYSGREQMEKDPDLASLQQDAQWADIVDQMSAEAKPSAAP